MGKKVGKSTRKNVSGNCIQNFTDHARQFAADAIKTNSKIIIQQKELGIWLVLILLIELISKNSHQNNSQTVTNEHDK